MSNLTSDNNQDQTQEHTIFVYICILYYILSGEDQNSQTLIIDRRDAITLISSCIFRYYKHLHKKLTGEKYHNDYEENDDLSAFDPSLNYEDTQLESKKD